MRKGLAAIYNKINKGIYEREKKNNYAEAGSFVGMSRVQITFMRGQDNVT